MNTTNPSQIEDSRSLSQETAVQEFLRETVEIFKNPIVWIGIICITLGFAASYAFVLLPDS